MIDNPAIFKAYDIRGLYADEIDADGAVAIGRAFTRVIAGLEGKPTAELRLGLAHDMRLSAPELAAAYCDGMRSEGATVLDAGRVATEMLYYLVGSRELDGGSDVHRLAQPQGLHRGQARQTRRDRALGRCRDRRRQDEDRGGSRRSAGRRNRREGRRRKGLPARRAAGSSSRAWSSRCGSSSTAATAWPGRWSGRCSSGLGLDLIEAYWEPDGNFPDHEPNPLLPENREFIMRRGRGTRGRPRASHGTATPTGASSSTSRARSSTAIS